MIARVHRGTDIIPFALNNFHFIDMEAPSGDVRFTRLNILFGDEAKRNTDGATPTRMCELDDIISVGRVRND